MALTGPESSDPRGLSSESYQTEWLTFIAYLEEPVAVELMGPGTAVIYTFSEGALWHHWSTILYGQLGSTGSGSQLVN